MTGWSNTSWPVGVAFLFLIISEAQSTPVNTTISGTAAVVDGDTLDVGSIRVRLFGIDAPETAQECADGRGAKWACGRSAKGALPQDHRPFEAWRVGRRAGARLTLSWSISSKRLIARRLRHYPPRRHSPGRIKSEHPGSARKGHRETGGAAETDHQPPKAPNYRTRLKWFRQTGICGRGGCSATLA